jgi:hypothetical protein
MRFALLGEHPDGLALAKALTATGRHQVVVYSGPRNGLEACRTFAPEARPVADLEEVLADPVIEAVIVAGRPGNRAEPLRRALQSERAVLCVHPVDPQPDAAYEAGMIQGDTKQVLVPLLTEGLHPAVIRLAELLHGPALGGLRLIEVEIAARGSVLIDADLPGHEPALPGWPTLRRLGGDIAEVSAFAQGEEVRGDEPLLVSGRFRSGGIFQLRLLPSLEDQPWRIRVLGASGHATLTLNRDATACLTGVGLEETWPPWDPWPMLVEAFESAGKRGPTWQDEVRVLELDDAARRSLERRRASSMEYQEASEEVGFKGTMTLVGCALLWSVLVLLILSAWVPWLGWAIAPVLAVFLGLQLLRWLIPREPPAGS